MTINILTIIVLLIIILCVFNGMRKGMLSILYGIVAWVFFIWFVNISTPIVSELLDDKTEISASVDSYIIEKLQVRYDTAEDEEVGTGLDSILRVLPKSIKEKVMNEVSNSVDSIITIVACEISDTIMRIISSLVSIVIALIILWLLRFIIKALGFLPGVKQVNRILGFAAGLVQAFLIIWIFLYVMDIFSYTRLANTVFEMCKDNLIMEFIKENNPFVLIFR